MFAFFFFEKCTLAEQPHRTTQDCPWKVQSEALWQGMRERVQLRTCRTLSQFVRLVGTLKKVKKQTKKKQCGIARSSAAVVPSRHVEISAREREPFLSSPTRAARNKRLKGITVFSLLDKKHLNCMGLPCNRF